MHLFGFGVIRNLIDDDSRLLHDSTGGWDPEGATTICRCTSIDLGPIATSAMQVESNGSDSVEVLLDDVAVPNDVLAFGLRFHALVRFTENAKVNFTLELSGAESGVWELAADINDLEALRGGEWHLVSLTRPAPTSFTPTLEPTVARLTVTAQWATSDEHLLWLRTPALCAPDTVTRNVAAVETFVRLPEYLREADSEESEPGYPLLRFTDVLMTVAHDVDRRWAGYRYLPPEDTATGVAKRSTLADPTLVDLRTVAWLAQLVGVTLVDPRVGVTSWESLMVAADGGGNGDGSPTWAEWVAAVDDDAPVLYDDDDDPGTPDVSTNLMQWDEIEDFDVNNTSVSADALLAFLRWQVGTAAYGLRGGTKTSLVTAARYGLVSTVLDGNGDPVPPTVDVIPHVGGDPWRMEVVVQADQVRDGSLDTIQDLLAPAVPAGFEVEAVFST